MRGYEGNHGRDIGIFIDGVPQNFPCSGVGRSGGSEMSWLVPEMIERVEVIKGPFSALYGDAAQAGVINITTKNSEPSSSVAASGASFGAFRTVPIVSTDYPLTVTPFLLNAFETLDGYRDNSQVKRFSSFSKGTVPLWNGYLSLRYSNYNSECGGSGLLTVNDVRKGLVERRSAVDPDDGTDQRRWSVVLNYSPEVVEKPEICQSPSDVVR